MRWELVLVDDGASRDVIQVVKRGCGAPLLERRYKFLAGGEWRNGAIRGWTAQDVEALLRHLDAILPELSRP